MLQVCFSKRRISWQPASEGWCSRCTCSVGIVALTPASIPDSWLLTHTAMLCYNLRDGKVIRVAVLVNLHTLVDTTVQKNLLLCLPL